MRSWYRKRAISIFLLFTLSLGSAAAQSGSLRNVNIITEPNASVLIDGVLYGKTDASGRLSIRSIPPGGHTIRVRADGFAESTKLISTAQKGDISIGLKRTENEAWLAFQEGERYSALDRTKAAEAYRKAIRLDPKILAAHIGLARVLSDGGDHEAALAAIKTLRKTVPRNAEASAVEGRIYKELDDEAKAIASFKRAITEGRGFQPEAYAGLGLLFKEKAEALDDPDHPEAIKASAEAARNLSMAVKQLSGAPDAMVIMQLLGLMYEQQKRYRDAIKVYEDFLRIFPDSNEAEAVRSFIVQINKQLASQ